MTYIGYKGTVKCEYCGFISLYGYQDKDKICNKFDREFFRFNAYETWKLNLYVLFVLTSLVIFLIIHKE